MSEQIVTSLVSVKEVRVHVEHITTAIPPQLAGSENARRMAEYSAAALGKVGVGAGELSRQGGAAGAGADRVRDRSEHARP